MRAALPLVLLGCILAGCVQLPPLDPTPALPRALDAATPFAFNFTAPSCSETDLLFFLDAPVLQKLLPDGFRVGDASALAGVPAATGKGVVLVANLVCEPSSIGPIHESATNILVETPKVNGSREAAAFDFYELFRYLDSPNETAPFEALAWDHFAGNVTAVESATGGAGTIQQSGKSVLDFSVTTPPGKALAGIGRFWHKTAHGLAYIDYKISSTQDVGAAQCAIAAGSPLAKAVGATSCDPGASAGMMFAPYALQASIVNLPGAKAT